ncbi:MAG: 50S ribosomal protein L3 [Candidatus Cardinium sp.]|uniref:Large ribosomal subunit protein uL3 n=1 Tax=Candidatus Cardinium hertigii TaxID=247481 RepID=A0A2Z3LH62_9BACT|nr:50S ribosomal protein L3 [Candidatus Cardinium hertigii]AWN81764.1 50S ribosomal protein L3 [Candidatus Cardinium hertigii]MDD9139590.1 50S ribosomal protein L3 [Candidatus Cardinium sp.]
MIGIIGKKIGMTSLYDGKGHKQACTVIQGGPCVVTQLKTLSVDGYQAVQLAYDDKKEKNTTKPLLGHFSKASTTPKRKQVEFSYADEAWPQQLALGQLVRLADIFEEGEFVDVVGRSKGKGFQGVVKRHGFSGVGGRSHGQHNRERAPGSIGANSDPSRVFKGMRMGGRTGGNRVKVKNLKVMKILPEKDLIVLCGAVPGAHNSYVILEK